MSQSFVTYDFSYIDDFRETFNYFDTNRDGKISATDLKNVFAKTNRNITEDELQSLINEIDVNQEGTISYEDLVAVMTTPISEDDLDREMWTAFSMMDTNGDGYLTAEELACGMAMVGANLTKEEVKELFSEADMDGDGRICFEEFVRLMLN